MTIGGTHKLTGGMNYAVIAKIPRDKLNKNAIGAAAESGLGFLKKEASKLGFDIDAGEFVNVLINITGSMTDPKLKFKILGSDGEASVQDAITDNIKAEAEKKIEEVKDEVVDKAKLEAEKKAEEVLGKSVADAKDDAKKVADSLANTAAKKAEEELKKKVGDKVGEQGKKEIDKVKDKLKDVKLPKFGKKKKKKEGN
jgi:vacuolar-type H+-ATPase subunit H